MQYTPECVNTSYLFLLISDRHADSSVHSSSVSIELQNVEGPDYPDGDEALTKKLVSGTTVKSVSIQ